MWDALCIELSQVNMRCLVHRAISDIEPIFSRIYKIEEITNTYVAYNLSKAKRPKRMTEADNLNNEKSNILKCIKTGKVVLHLLTVINM